MPQPAALWPSPMAEAMADILKVRCQTKNSTRIYYKNNPAKFLRNPVWNDEGFLKEERRPNNKMSRPSGMGSVPDQKNRRLAARTSRISLTDCFFFRLTLNIEESSKNKALSRFQVDLKQNRLRSTKPVVEVSKIDSTRLGSLKSTRVDLNRLTPRSKHAA